MGTLNLMEMVLTIWKLFTTFKEDSIIRKKQSRTSKAPTCTNVTSNFLNSVSQIGVSTTLKFQLVSCVASIPTDTFKVPKSPCAAFTSSLLSNHIKASTPPPTSKAQYTISHSPQKRA